MDVSILSLRYAKALSRFAAENGDEKKVYDECTLLSSSFSEVKELRSAIGSPLVKSDAKTSLLTAACSPEGVAVSESMTAFISLVLKNGRGAYLGSMALIYGDLYRDSKHIAVARLTTAVPIDKDTLDRIGNKTKERIHAIEMDFDTVVDKSIEGGFIFDFNDFRVDASVRTRLMNIRKQLTDRNRRIV